MKWLTLKRQSAAPAHDPQSGEDRVYLDSSGDLRAVSSAGVDRALGGGGEGGGSQSVESVILPLNFDTPDLIVKTFAITAVDQGAQKLTIAGNHTALFPSGKALAVHGSTGNDGSYTVDTVTFTGGNTEIVTVEALPDATVDGAITNSGTAGIHVTTLHENDVLLGDLAGTGKPMPFCWLYYPTPWDGSSPVVYLTTPEQQGNYLVQTIEEQALDNIADDDYFGDGSLFTFINNYSGGGLDMNVNGHMRAGKTVELIVLADDGSGGDPGSTVGEAILVLHILRAS